MPPSTDELSRLQQQLDAERARSRRLRAVAETASMVNSTLDLRELAHHIIEAATGLIGAERGSLFLVEGDTLRSLVAQGLDLRPLTLAVGEGIVGAVAATGEAVILNDPYGDSRFDPSVDRITGFTTRSLLTVPVRDRDGVLTAVLQLLNRRSGPFSSADVEFLAELGVPFAVALTTARMHREIVRRERLREELRLAAEIQRALQPVDGTRIPGLEISTLFKPCLEVGGDYWDLIPADDGTRWWLTVADISGKGVAAGLIASNVQAFLWSRRDDRRHLGRVVAECGELLYRLARGRKFATLFVAEWRPAEQAVEWVSAGHPPVYVRTRDGLRDLPATGVPIGLLPGQSYRSERLELAPGDELLVYTDGVFESGFDGGEEFGLERVRRCFERATTGDVLERLQAELEDHLDGAEPDDDVTVLLARCSGEGGGDE